MGCYQAGKLFDVIIITHMIKTCHLATQSALLPNPTTLLHLSTHISSHHATDPVLFPGCPRADDLSVLRSDDLPSSSPVTAQDLADLRELLVDLNRICSRARERDVRLIVDAEYSWYQASSTSFLYPRLLHVNLVRSPLLIQYPCP
jgi:proline dehydrogenase